MKVKYKSERSINMLTLLELKDPCTAERRRAMEL